MVDMQAGSEGSVSVAKPAARKPARKPAPRTADAAKHRRVSELLHKLEQKGKELAASADLMLARLP